MFSSLCVLVVLVAFAPVCSPGSALVRLCLVLAFVSPFVSCSFVLVCLCFCVRNSHVVGQWAAVLRLLCLRVSLCLSVSQMPSYQACSVTLIAFVMSCICLWHVLLGACADWFNKFASPCPLGLATLGHAVLSLRPALQLVESVCTASLAMHVHNLPSCFLVFHFVCARASFSIFARMGQILCSACVTRDNGGWAWAEERTECAFCFKLLASCCACVLVCSYPFRFPRSLRWHPSVARSRLHAWVCKQLAFLIVVCVRLQGISRGELLLVMLFQIEFRNKQSFTEQTKTWHTFVLQACVSASVQNLQCPQIQWNGFINPEVIKISFVECRQ